jgi:DNA polymerase-3 subunit beta
MVMMTNPDDKGQATLTADTDGEGFVRIDGQYLAEALKACGGMVDFKLTNALSPMLFTANGYQLVVMPMMTDKANEQAKKDREAKAEQPTEPADDGKVYVHKGITYYDDVAEQVEAEAMKAVYDTDTVKPETEPVAEKSKRVKRSRKRDKVAVA